MNHEVVISYSNKDKNVADAIVNRFESSGLKCWYAPRDINPGSEWAESIVEAIKASKKMILIFTDYSNASKQVVREVETAINSGVVVIPFKLTASNPSGSMEYYLSTLHWLDAMDKPLDNAINDLKEMVINIDASKSYVQKKKRNLKTIIISSILVLAMIVSGIFFIITNKNKNNESDVFIPVDYNEKNINNCLNSNLVYYYDDENLYYNYLLWLDDEGETIPYPLIFVTSERDFLWNIADPNKLVCIKQTSNFAATKDFIFDAPDSGGIIRHDVLSGEEITIYTNNCSNLLINGDWLLFIDLSNNQLMRISFDGSIVEQFDGVYARSFFVHDKRIFFISNDGTLCIYDSGDIINTNNNNIINMCYGDSNLYLYCSVGNGIYSVPIKRREALPEYITAIEDELTFDFTYWNNKLYYINEDKKIHELDLITKADHTISTQYEFAVDISIVNGSIYVMTADSENNAYIEIIELQ